MESMMSIYIVQTLLESLRITIRPSSTALQGNNGLSEIIWLDETVLYTCLLSTCNSAAAYEFMSSNYCIVWEELSCPAGLSYGLFLHFTLIAYVEQFYVW